MRFLSKYISSLLIINIRKLSTTHFTSFQNYCVEVLILINKLKYIMYKIII